MLLNVGTGMILGVHMRLVRPVVTKQGSCSRCLRLPDDLLRVESVITGIRIDKYLPVM